MWLQSQPLLLVSWLLTIHHFNSVLCEEQTAATTVTKTKDVVYGKASHIHLVWNGDRSANLGGSVQKDTPSEAGTFTTIHLHLQSPHFQYMEQPCSIATANGVQHPLLRDVCGEQVRQLWQQLEVVKAYILQHKYVDDLQPYASAICPWSEPWVSFTSCFCSKCNKEMISIPNEHEWITIWSQLPFCYANTQKQDFQNLCQWMFHQKATEGAGQGGAHLDVDGMFEAAWHGTMSGIVQTKGHMHSIEHTTVTHTVQRRESVLRDATKRKNDEDEDEDEDEQDVEQPPPPNKKKTEQGPPAVKAVGAEEQEEKKEEEGKKEEEEKKDEREEEEKKEKAETRRLSEQDNLSGTSFLSVHSMVYVWTFMLATAVTIVSFFVLVR